MSGLLAVVVLYKMRIEDSPAYQGLARALRESDEARRRIEVVICDNSLEAQPVPNELRARYRHDGTNPGLAKRYNEALAMAEEHGSAWLLLLDQDTSLTAEFIDEALELCASLESDATVAAIVPKLVQNGQLLSPHLPSSFGEQRGTDVNSDSYGVLPQRVLCYNSGALMRVHALRAIGGFPEEFWLDYLDHATFHALRSHGGKVFVMRSILKHELATNTDAGRAVSPERERNILKAERLYYRKFGTIGERLRFALRRIKMIFTALLRGDLQRCRMLFITSI